LQKAEKTIEQYKANAMPKECPADWMVKEIDAMPEAELPLEPILEPIPLPGE
jgi:hypothetical protein